MGIFSFLLVCETGTATFGAVYRDLSRLHARVQPCVFEESYRKEQREKLEFCGSVICHCKKNGALNNFK